MANIKMPNGQIVDSESKEYTETTPNTANITEANILNDISTDIKQLQSFLNYWVLKGVGDNTLPILGTVYNTLTSMSAKIESHKQNNSL